VSAKSHLERLDVRDSVERDLARPIAGPTLPALPASMKIHRAEPELAKSGWAESGSAVPSPVALKSDSPEIGPDLFSPDLAEAVPAVSGWIAVAGWVVPVAVEAQDRFQRSSCPCSASLWAGFAPRIRARAIPSMQRARP